MHECTCSPSNIERYQRRISGPLLDRIDMFVDVPRVEYDKLEGKASTGDSSSTIRDRVEQARAVQSHRFVNSPIIANAEMGASDVRQFCQNTLDEGGRSLLRLATNQLGLSARAFHRILKLSRTIADLAGSDAIGSAHVAEAVQYRHRAPV
jgi:magnesium chelatase family protein